MRRDASLRKSEGTIDISARLRTGSTQAGTKERVRPRRRRPKRSPWRIVLSVIGYAVLIACAVVVVCEASRPFMLYDREKEAAMALQKQLEDCRRENAALERRIKHLQTPEGQAQAARELGWVRPGEITLVIPDKTTTDSEE